MSEIRVPHNALILVMDSSRALLLRNAGTPVQPSLRVEQHLQAQENPLSHGSGSDRPGRMAVGFRRSSMEEGAFHERQEMAFAELVAQWSDHFIRQHDEEHGLGVIAPPRCLAILRRVLPATSRKHIFFEIDKDLAGMPLEAIETWLKGH